MAQAHDFADGADGGLTIAANAAKTVYDANGVPALAGAGHVSHDEGSGANPHLLLVGATEQVCEHPVSFGNWTTGGVILTDLGQDGIFRKGRMQSNGQSWHAARDWNGTNDLVLSVNDEFTITWWFDETTRTMSPRMGLRAVGGGFFNINGVMGSGGSGLSASGDYTALSEEFEEVRADMWRKSLTARANVAMTLEGLTIEARTTNTALIADLYGAQITNLSYFDGAIAGYSRAADVITALSVSAQTAGALVARYDALHGSGDIIGLRSNAAPARRMAIARNETANQIQAVAHDGTAEIANLGAAQTDTVKHVAFGFDQDDFGASINNAAALTDTAGTFGALDELYIGDGPGVLKLYAYSLLDARPSNADLATLVAGEAPASTTPVFADLDSAFNIRDLVLSDMASSWNIIQLTTVGNDLSSAFGLRENVNADVASSYNLREHVSGDLVSGYNLRNAIAADLASSWNIVTLGVVGADLSSAFALRNTVSEDLSSSFGIRTLVSEDLSSSFNLRTLVSEDMLSSWNIVVNGVVGANLSSGFNLAETVAASLDSSFAVLNFVSNDVDSSFSLRQNASADMQSSWNIVTVDLVGADLTSAFGVRENINGDLQSAYRIYSNDAPSRASDERTLNIRLTPRVLTIGSHASPTLH